MNNLNTKKNFRYYKGIKVNSFGFPILNDEKKPVIKRKERKRDFYNNTFPSYFKKDSPKDLLLMYDVPSNLKKERDWLRRHLKRFGYMMIQKSVWVGPSPLPKDFLDYLKEIKIGDCFKTFKLEKAYTFSKK